MRIYICCAVDGCSAKFGGNERVVLGQYRIHMEGHQLKVREANEKAVKRREAKPLAKVKRLQAA